MATSVAAVSLTYDPPGPVFYINEECEMPVIKVKAQLQKAGVAGGAAPTYQWTVTLVHDGAGCVNSLGRKTSHPDISATTSTNTRRCLS
jgi:hypothetical protein